MEQWTTGVPCTVIHHNNTEPTWQHKELFATIACPHCTTLIHQISQAGPSILLVATSYMLRQNSQVSWGSYQQASTPSDKTVTCTIAVQSKDNRLWPSSCRGLLCMNYSVRVCSLHARTWIGIQRIKPPLKSPNFNWLVLLKKLSPFRVPTVEYVGPSAFLRINHASWGKGRERNPSRRGGQVPCSLYTAMHGGVVNPTLWDTGQTPSLRAVSVSSFFSMLSDLWVAADHFCI